MSACVVLADSAALCSKYKLQPHLAVHRLVTSLNLLTVAVILSIQAAMDVAHIRHIYVTQEDAESLPIRVPSVFLIRGH